MRNTVDGRRDGRNIGRNFLKSMKEEIPTVVIAAGVCVCPDS
jgi:hypothetical protein